MIPENRKSDQTPGDKEAGRKAPSPPACSEDKLLPVPGRVWAIGSRAVRSPRGRQSSGWSVGATVLKRQVWINLSGVLCVF